MGIYASKNTDHDRVHRRIQMCVVEVVNHSGETSIRRVSSRLSRSSVESLSGLTAIARLVCRLGTRRIRPKPTSRMPAIERPMAAHVCSRHF
jgi:hypothetical protein